VTIDLLIAAAGWIVAALLVGLWLGERGRRRSAERLLVTGLPDVETPPPAVSRVPSEEAEDRFQREAQAYTDEAVERGTAQLVEDAKAAGITVDRKQIRRDVEKMLSGEDVLD
jgi:histone H3/H4